MKIVEQLGVVESFELPDDWTRETPPLLGGRTIRLFRPGDASGAVFVDAYRALPLSRTASEMFQTVLYAPFHGLDAAEIAGLREVFEGLSNTDVFTVDTADSSYLNNRRIIRVMGSWVQNKQKTLSLFLDVEGHGQYVQNLYFSAPQNLFGQLTGLAEGIFDSVVWTTQS